MNVKQVLTRLVSISGVGGAEQPIQRTIENILTEELGISPEKITVDPLGNLICMLHSGGKGKHILLDAHVDEIGLFITGIDENGLLEVAASGGIDRRTLPNTRVVIHGKAEISGVFGSTPPHLSGPDTDSYPEIKDFRIDTGYDREALTKIVEPGDPVTIFQSPMELAGNQITAKSLDNRAGAMILLRFAEHFLKAQTKQAGRITLVFSVQEETTGSGAGTSAYHLNPDEAIIIDTSFAYTPGCAKEKCGHIGKGPMLGIAPIISREIFEALKQTARQAEIPYQVEVMGGKTGTNADSVQISRYGVKTGLVSPPLKYMHTPVESVSYDDLELCAKLLYHYIQNEKN